MTEQITPELASAFCKAQALMSAAVKDTTNPHLRSKYADLASVIEAVKEPLSSNGLAYMQHVTVQWDGEPGQTRFYWACCNTTVMHITGAYFSVQTRVPLKPNPNAQDAGSGFTYAKRYGLQSLFGIPSEDDDGNQASAKTGNNSKDSTKPGSGGGTVVSAVDAWIRKAAESNLSELSGLRVKLGQTKLSPEDKSAVLATIESCEQSLAKASVNPAGNGS